VRGAKTLRLNSLLESFVFDCCGKAVLRQIARSKKVLSSRLSRTVLCLLVAVPLVTRPLDAQVERETTAWQQGSFHVDRKEVIGRSDIILQKPNESPQQAMPLGNGRLGLAVWAQDGYTAQLNRGDTFPLRLSPGQIVVPGLKQLTQAGDYSARLNLYDGEFQQQGGGMTATTYVMDALDAVAIEVKGADPKTTQTAELRLWSPRQPQGLAEGEDRHPGRDMARQQRSRSQW
jgi:alpha-L-fucosidase 2